MTHDPISPRLDRVWNEVEFLCATPGAPGDWKQSGYRESIFAAFSELYHIKKLHGDQLVAEILERHSQLDDANQEEKLNILCSIRDAWDEWLFAWDNHPG